MPSIIAQWEDRANHRQIQYTIEYTFDDGQLTIDQIVPTKVSFVCSQSNTVLRSIGVHTESGRVMLSRQIIAAGQVDLLESKLAERHGELASA